MDEETVCLTQEQMVMLYDKSRNTIPNPDATILLLAGVAMAHKVYQRKVPKLDYEKEKFKWEE